MKLYHVIRDGVLEPLEEGTLPQGGIILFLPDNYEYALLPVPQLHASLHEAHIKNYLKAQKKQKRLEERLYTKRRKSQYLIELWSLEEQSEKEWDALCRCELYTPFRYLLSMLDREESQQSYGAFLKLDQMLFHLRAESDTIAGLHQDPFHFFEGSMTTGLDFRLRQCHIVKE